MSITKSCKIKSYAHLFSDLDDVLLSGNSPNNSLSVSSGDERDPRARSPSQERSRRKDKYTIHEFNFIKVLGKGSFGKVRASICLVHF